VTAARHSLNRFSKAQRKGSEPSRSAARSHFGFTFAEAAAYRTTRSLFNPEPERLPMIEAIRPNPRAIKTVQ
jgi:hypothetical protein